MCPAWARPLDDLSKLSTPTCRMPVDCLSVIVGGMDSQSTETQFIQALCARVRALRDSKGWTAEDMAMALGIPADRYRKYETRSPLPHFLIPKLALIVDRSVELILTGRDRRDSPAEKATNGAHRKRA